MEHNLNINNSFTSTSIETKSKKPYIFKLQISPEQYSLLFKKFDFKETKENNQIYFDSSSSPSGAILFKNNIRLRIRVEKDKYTWEFKKKDENIFEIIEPISTEDYQNILNGILPEGEIKKNLIKMNFPLKLQQVGSSISLKSKVSFNDGELILDKTIYNNNNVVSYGVEFRSAKIFKEDEIKDIINNKLEISDIKINKTKLQLLWEENNNLQSK